MEEINMLNFVLCDDNLVIVNKLKEMLEVIIYKTALLQAQSKSAKKVLP